VSLSCKDKICRNQDFGLYLIITDKLGCNKYKNKTIYNLKVLMNDVILPKK
jgi:hypothetical protein